MAGALPLNQTGAWILPLSLPAGVIMEGPAISALSLRLCLCELGVINPSEAVKGTKRNAPDWASGGWGLAIPWGLFSIWSMVMSQQQVDTRDTMVHVQLHSLTPHWASSP